MTISVDFPAGDFIAGARFAMQMGASPNSDDRAKFIFKAVGARTYWKAGVQVGSTVVLDQDGNPLDLDVEVRTDQPKVVYQRKAEAVDPTHVDCAVEFTDANAGELPVGLNLRPTKLIVTLLDDDFRKVEGCREIVMGSDRYLFSYSPPALGLFTVGLRQMVFYALDES